MYLAEIKLWNFRKYGSQEEFNLGKPHITIPFSEGLNVLIGENDSGKTAILDAIKIVLKHILMNGSRLKKRIFGEIPINSELN